MVDGEIALQEVFTFKQVSVTPDGRAVGYHSATGARSSFEEHFRSNGVQLTDSMFSPTAEPAPDQLS